MLAADASTSDIEDVATVKNEQLCHFISYCAVPLLVNQWEGKRIGEFPKN